MVEVYPLMDAQILQLPAYGLSLDTKGMIDILDALRKEVGSEYVIHVSVSQCAVSVVTMPF